MIKIIGAAMIVLGCGAFGFKLASDYVKRINSLKQLIWVLDFFTNELQYRLTSLPELCRQASRNSKGAISDFFASLEHELDSQVSPDVERCVSAALYKHKEIPADSVKLLELLGHSLGRFDLAGQLNCLESVKKDAQSLMEKLDSEKELRVRNYKTLAICAGVALAILFV